MPHYPAQSCLCSPTLLSWATSLSHALLCFPSHAPSLVTLFLGLRITHCRFLFLLCALCSRQPPDPHTPGRQKTKEAGVDQKTRKMSSCFRHSPLPPVGPAGSLGSVPSQGHLVGFHSSRGPQASAWCSGHQKHPNWVGIDHSPCPPGVELLDPCSPLAGPI